MNAEEAGTGEVAMTRLFGAKKGLPSTQPCVGIAGIAGMAREFLPVSVGKPIVATSAANQASNAATTAPAASQ